MISLVIIVTDAIVGYDVFTKVHSRFREHRYLRNLHLLNLFHYITDIRTRLANAFGDTIAPETTQVLYEEPPED